jgi:hypothetical protein
VLRGEDIACVRYRWVNIVMQQPLCSDTKALTVLSTICHITPLANRRKFDRFALAKHVLFLNFYPPAYRVFFVSACKVGIKRVRIDIMSKNIPVGSALVVGGGIAGMQAALDLADSGYLVHLVEKSSAIGGVMSELDKTFPTNDCAM